MNKTKGWNIAYRHHVQWLRLQLRLNNTELAEAEKSLAYLKGSINSKKDALENLLSNRSGED